MTVTLHFHGAAGTVTGSCYRVTHKGGQFLVDCGMFQGNKSVRDLNYKPFPFAAREIDFVLLTHAHIDHAGLLPKLTAHGFRNPIWMTEPTAGPARIPAARRRRHPGKRSRARKSQARPGGAMLRSLHCSS